MSDTETEVNEEVEAETGKGARKGSMPVYKLEKVEGDLPEAAPAGRANMYVSMLAPLTELDPGDWYCVATFKTPTGAGAAKKSILDGTRPIPDGQWEVEARKIANPEDVNGQKWSKLYARYLGPDEA